MFSMPVTLGVGERRVVSSESDLGLIPGDERQLGPTGCSISGPAPRNPQALWHRGREESSVRIDDVDLPGPWRTPGGMMQAVPCPVTLKFWRA
jgi:hypothetical protein